MGFNSKKIFRLGDFCKIGDGIHASVARQSDGVRYLTSKNFKPHGLDLTKIDYISDEDFDRFFNRSKSSLIKPSEGDVLFGIIGTIGTPYLVKKEDFFGISSSVGILRPNANICPYFLYHYMRSSMFKMEVDNIKSGSAQGFLSLKMIASISIVNVDLCLQKKIAAILSAYDDLIENNKRRISVLEQMAEEIYREWFVRFRFPGYKQAEFEKGIPKGWSVKKIGEVFKTSSGGTPSRNKSENYEGDVDWLKTGELKNIFTVDSVEKISLEGVESSSAKIFPEKTVVIAMYCAMPYISILSRAAATNQACCAFFPKRKSFSYAYTYHLIKFAQSHLIQFAHGAAQQNLSQGLIQGYPLLVAEESLISDFSLYVEPIFEEIKNIGDIVCVLEKTKNQLLPRLISGKLSVDDLDIQFPPSMLDNS